MFAKVLEGKGNFGFNAQTGEYGDMVAMGVPDPTKVTRTALQNAASVAALILTTESGYYLDTTGKQRGFIASPVTVPSGTTSNGAYTFTVNVVPNTPIIVDPPMAVAYDYALGKHDPRFASVRLPIGIGDSLYVLVVNGRRFAVAGGTLFDFRANGFAKGVKAFRVACIETSASLDPANPLAFPTELTFVGVGTFTGSQRPLVDPASGPSLCERAVGGDDGDEGEGRD